MTRLKKIGQGVLKHRTPGRLRIALSSLIGNRKLSGKLQTALDARKTVVKSRVRAFGGSIVVWYDPSRVSEDSMIEEIDGFLTDFFARSHENDNFPAWKNGTNVWNLKNLGLQLLGSAVLGIFLTYTLFKRIFGSPVSQRMYSVAGIAAIIAAIPLLWQAVQERKRHKRFGLLLFLTGACALAIFTGQALTAIEIIWLMFLGNAIETWASERAAREVRRSLEVTSEKAFVLKNGTEVEILVADLSPGDVVTAYLGDKIAADGIVEEGEALVDESRITGRWEPSHMVSGDKVYAGSEIVQGSIHVRAEKTGDETYLGHIARMVEQSLENRTESERAADELARRLTKLGALSTVVTLIATRNLSRSLSVLMVMACPCATILAASTAVAAAIANAARNHILIKDGRYLEKSAKIDVVCFDKTGTITTDMPQVAEIVTRTPNQDPNKVLGFAASAEIKSRHPAAKALMNYAADANIELSPSEKHQEFPGLGVGATLGEDEILVGNRAFMESREINHSYFKTKSKNAVDEGKTVLFVARNGKLQGMISLENAYRPGADAVLHRLRRLGVEEIHMISGDQQAVVDRICSELQFDACRAEMLPDQKAWYVESLVKNGHSVIMVGDGINDALAFSKADIGAAMGAGGSETAIETADIAFLTNDLNSIAILRQLGIRTINTVEVNFRIAVGTDILGILLGAAGLLAPGPFGLLHIAHTMAIFYNSGRLLKD